MTRQQMIEAIRETCIAANPSKDWDTVYAHLGLADVLVAIEYCLRDRFESQPNADLLSNFQEGLWSITRELIKKYNLRADDFTQQSDETITFLYELLK